MEEHIVPLRRQAHQLRLVPEIEAQELLNLTHILRKHKLSCLYMDFYVKFGKLQNVSVKGRTPQPPKTSSTTQPRSRNMSRNETLGSNPKSSAKQAKLSLHVRLI